MRDLLYEDARATMPPSPAWQDGRAAIMLGLSQRTPPGAPLYNGRWRMLATTANRQPAAASYLRRPGDDAYRAFAFDVLRIAAGRIAEITTFIQPGAISGECALDVRWDVFRAFGLPTAV